MRTFALQKYRRYFELNALPSNPTARWEHCRDKIESRRNDIVQGKRGMFIVIACMVALGVFLSATCPYLFMMFIVFFPVLGAVVNCIVGIPGDGYLDKDLLRVCDLAARSLNPEWQEQFKKNLMERQSPVTDDIIATGYISETVASNYNRYVEFDTVMSKYGSYFNFEPVKTWDEFVKHELIPDLPTV